MPPPATTACGWCRRASSQVSKSSGACGSILPVSRVAMQVWREKGGFKKVRAFVICVAAGVWLGSAGAASFVNFETPQVHPIDLSPDGTKLAVCNTADGRVELFDIRTG